ncbi:aromatic dipeptide epimerase [Abditibacteriota bacterium]|nr:aromatic dipeptide epimerase [Abditibacteriota bacterium]
MAATATTIRSLSVQELNIPLWESFGIAGGAQQIAKNLLVTIELADGTRGYGEAAPFPSFNGETQKMAFDAINASKSILEGADVWEWRRLHQEIRRSINGIGSAQCALETAILDALTRHSRMPMWAFFGGHSTQLETDMTLPIPTLSNENEGVEHATNFTRTITSSGIKTVKIKVGGDFALDVKRIEGVRDQAPESSILLDGNAGYESAEIALHLLESLGRKGIVPALFEQPVPKDDLKGLRQLTQNTEVPIAADESAYNLASVKRIIDEAAANVVNIKLMKFGVIEAWDSVCLCKAANIGLMIGGMVESPLSMTMSACFAAGIGGFNYIDLDTPFFMESIPLKGGCYRKTQSPNSGRIEVGPTLDLRGIAEGHGVVPLATG